MKTVKCELIILLQATQGEACEMSNEHFKWKVCVCSPLRRRTLDGDVSPLYKSSCPAQLLQVAMELAPSVLIGSVPKPCLVCVSETEVKLEAGYTGKYLSLVTGLANMGLLRSYFSCYTIFIYNINVSEILAITGRSLFLLCFSMINMLNCTEHM